MTALPVQGGRNEKIEQLSERLSKASGCSLCHDWKIDFLGCRFYFRSAEHRGWRYILDVNDGDIEEQSVDQLLANLEASQWQKVLSDYSGKLVPYFKDKEFVPETGFCRWPRQLGE
jgi:hypothetical protein